MGNCLRDGAHFGLGILLSLRDPDGCPHASIDAFDGRVLRAEGRFRRPVSEKHEEILGRLFASGGLGEYVQPDPSVDQATPGDDAWMVYWSRIAEQGSEPTAAAA